MNSLFHFFADAYWSQNVLAVDSIVEVGVAAFFHKLILDVGAVSGVAGQTQYHAKGVRSSLAELLDVPDDVDKRLVVGVRLVADELPDVERLDLVEEHGQALALLPYFRQHLLEGGSRHDIHVQAQQVDQWELLVFVVVIDAGDLGFEFAEYATEALHDGGLTDALDACDEQTRTIAVVLLAGAYLKNVGNHSSDDGLHNGGI